MVLENIKSKKGFTIVELLVVIVVIGILAAITVVSYTGVSDRAKASQAASNGKTVASVAETYYADCGIYPTIAQLDSGCTAQGAAVAKLPTSIDPVGAASGALVAGDFDKEVIYVLESNTGVCIATYDPTYTGGTYPNLKLTFLGSAAAFSANPNTGAATCS